MLEETIASDLKRAMKERDEVKLSTLRMLRAALVNFALEKKKATVTDEEVVDQIAKQIKQRKDSIDQFRKGGRSELAQKEEGELKVLECYMPPQMTEAELKSLVEDTVRRVGARQKREAGRVMKELMPKVKGRAEAGRVNEVVLTFLE